MLNNTYNGLTTFNKKRLHQALIYLAKTQKLSLTKYLLNKDLLWFYRSYLITTKRKPTLETLVKVCDTIGLDVRTIVFNDGNFNVKTDLVKASKPKARDIRYGTLEDFNLACFRVYNYFKNKNTLPIKPTLHFINKQRALLLFDLGKIAPAIYIYLFYKNKKLYALHDINKISINNLKKEFNAGFTLLTAEQLSTYYNIVYTHTLKLQQL